MIDDLDCSPKETESEMEDEQAFSQFEKTKQRNDEKLVTSFEKKSGDTLLFRFAPLVDVLSDFNKRWTVTVPKKCSFARAKRSPCFFGSKAPHSIWTRNLCETEGEG